MSDPIASFIELQLSAPLLQALTDVGYETPSPIQAACIPPLLAGRDLLGEAQTGTGKTAAFALPFLQLLDLKLAQPQVLVLTPTRELAIQVAEAFQRYAKHLPGFHVLPIYGGQSMVLQLRQLRRGAHVIVGTPGRVMDHLQRKSLVLDHLKGLVLDEADEMLRMGFIEDVEWILEHTPATRQTALFSATMPKAILGVARAHMREPEEVKIRSSTTTVAAIRQRYWQVVGTNKLDALTRILEVEEELDAALIFVRTKIATAELAEKLEARGYSAAALNGDMTQQLRERVIEQFKSGGIDIVVATDVAARGIDVARISHVINYDIPYDTEAYVHRIGRTGRAGRTGNAILFVAPREIRMLRSIERATRQPIEALSLPSREAVAGRRVAQFKKRVVAAMAYEGLDFFIDVVSQIENDIEGDLRQIAAALALMATNDKPLQLPASERSFERNEPEPRQQREAPGRQRAPRAPSFEPRDAQLVPYRIAVGTNQGATPSQIVGAIANEAGIESRYIGRIALHDDFSTVDLPADLPAEVLAILKRTRVRQCQLDIQRDTGGRPEREPRRSAPRDSPRRTEREPRRDAPFEAPHRPPRSDHEPRREAPRETLRKRPPKRERTTTGPGEGSAAPRERAAPAAKERWTAKQKQERAASRPAAAGRDGFTPLKRTAQRPADAARKSGPHKPRKS